eukprot:3482676-Amphidinium_carterae.1
MRTNNDDGNCQTVSPMLPVSSWARGSILPLTQTHLPKAYPPRAQMSRFLQQCKDLRSGFNRRMSCCEGAH